jgi:hypothetical protein
MCEKKPHPTLDTTHLKNVPVGTPEPYMPPMADEVKFPSHYNWVSKSEYEPKFVLQEWGKHLPWWVTNAIKYLTRFQDKGNPVKDLAKAIEYIQLQMEEELAKTKVSTSPSNAALREFLGVEKQDNNVTGESRGTDPVETDTRRCRPNNSNVPG